MRLTKNGVFNKRKPQRHRGHPEKVKKLVFKVPSIKRGFRGVFDTAFYKPFMQCSPRLCSNSFFIFVSDIKNIASSARKTITMFNNYHAGKAARNALEMVDILK